MINFSFIEEGVGVRCKMSVDVSGRKPVDIIGDQVRGTIPKIAEFPQRHDDLVEVTWVAVTPLAVGDAAAATHALSLRVSLVD